MWSIFNKKNLTMMFCQMSYGLSFYGVAIVLMPFFLEELHYNEASTMMVVGAFTSVGTLFAIAGGVVGDKILGSFRALTVGYVCFTTGYLLLLLSAVNNTVSLSLLGIALVCYGRGLMSPNYPTLFKTTFSNPEDFEKGYPINYSINNVGSFLGEYCFPFLVLLIGYKGNFSLAAALCGLSVLSLFIIRKPLRSTALPIDRETVSKKNWQKFGWISLAMILIVFYMFNDLDTGVYLVYAISFGAIAYFIYLMMKSNHAVKLRLLTVLFMIFLTIAFFVYYGQMSTSMNIVAINTMRGDLLGFIPIRPEGSSVMNSAWCIVVGPMIALLFGKLESKKIFLSTATKVGLAFVGTSIAFGFFTFCIYTIGDKLVLRPEVFLVVHFFQAFGEVIIASLVVAYILSVAPKNISAFAVSLFMISIALSGIIGAVFSTNVALEKGEVLTRELVIARYGSYYLTLTIWAVIFTVIAFASSILTKKILHAADRWEAEHPELADQNTKSAGIEEKTSEPAKSDTQEN
ncbi:peptide MFS transporter [Dichelobacter nodosus]|uniref:Tripeptide permease family protein n=1 Tax=Dichelobacter nodosus (strain VCS1703A) TaxID=246195 RepID=A5EXG9_DICNV|nr:oligopeptide:H+ symporter [Dichelobacter nodosus]ABQ14037.1 tripeptide permease family protein [Dichelobacter nodosus VCS1703A]AXM45957.1 MFS transporter [Dichelobacter nodosus]KNZ39119.1 DeoR faimly transcriptional regulator [Dichelobacter nodosus]TGA64590.1 MFS transporter [Dichelobacter nodosus]